MIGIAVALATHSSPTPRNLGAAIPTTKPTPADRPVRPGTLTDLCWLAISGAVLVTLVSLGIVTVQWHLLRTLTWTSRDFGVLALAGNLAVFLLFGVPIGGLAALTRRRFGVVVPATAFAGVAVLGILLALPAIHPLAKLVLAGGVAIQFGALVRREPEVWMRRVRALALGGAIGLVLLGILTRASRHLSERDALAALPSAGGEAPNILLLILDTVRAANLSAYGYARPTTPTLERLAAESALFSWAFSPASWTGPSHASMMTGLHAGPTGADYQRPMTDTVPTVAEVLAGRGYVTGAFMANAGFAGHQMGLDRGFSRFEDYSFTWQQALWSSAYAQTQAGLDALEAIEERNWGRLGRTLMAPDLRRVVVRRGREHTAAEISGNFLRWRDRGGPARPYFAMLNMIDAHAPYAPPDGFAGRFGGGRQLLDRYDGSIAYVDSIVGHLVGELQARGELDRTVLIITSDHGELFGEHDLRGHGSSLFLPVLHVPLLVRAPGTVPGGMRVPGVVSLRDLAATLVEIGGAPAGTLTGASLAAHWRGTPDLTGGIAITEASAAVNPAPRNLTRFGPIRGSVDSAWHYIRYGNGNEELFAWRTDPDELKNLAATAAGRPIAARYRDRVAEALGLPRLPAAAAQDPPGR